MLPDRVSNPGPLTYESGALLIALRGPANFKMRWFIIRPPHLDLPCLQIHFLFFFKCLYLILQANNYYHMLWDQNCHNEAILW